MVFLCSCGPPAAVTLLERLTLWVLSWRTIVRLVWEVVWR